MIGILVTMFLVLTRKNLGTYYYFEDDFFESIEPIIHDMIAFGNNAKECLENEKSILKC